MATVVLKVLGMSVTEIIEKGRQIVTALTGNADFTTPIPTLLVLTGLIDALETANNEAANGDKVKKAQMEFALKDLLAALKTLTGYVQAESGGDPAKILTSGLSVKQPRTPTGILPPPVKFRGVQGLQPGQLILRWNGVAKRLIYKLERNDKPGDDTQWKDLVFTSKLRYNAAGLTSGSTYAFRIATITSAGIGSNSNPIEVKVL